MKIARQTFSYSQEQEHQLMFEKPQDQLVRPNDKAIETPGLDKATPTTISGWRPLTFEETLEAVQDFANCLGKDKLVNICEYTKNQMRIGDDRTTVWVIWYWCH